MTATTTTAPPKVDPETQAKDDFLSYATEHEMTVLHDHGLYRHLRFKSPHTGIGWFEIITWPGTLTIRGDMGCYVLSRLEDMFDFFAASHGGINAQYWAEKVQAQDRFLRDFQCVIAGRDDKPGGAFTIEIPDSWEWDLKGYSHQYLWCCWAIVWGIAKYRGDALPAPSGRVPGPGRPERRDRSPSRHRCSTTVVPASGIETVHVTGGVL